MNGWISGGGAAVAVALGLLVPPADADRVKLADGDVLTGPVAERSTEHGLVEHATLGSIRLHVADAPDTDAASGGAVVAPAAFQETVGGTVEKEWKSRFDLGFTGSFGNTDEQNLRLGLTSRREREESTTDFDASYYLGLSNGDRSDNRVTTGVLHRWLLSDSPWGWFADARFDYDEFQSWEYRVSTHTGPTLHLVNRENYDNFLRAGVGGRYDFESQDNGWFWEALFGVDVIWQITEKQSFEFHATFFPDLSDTGEFRTVTDASWVCSLDEAANLSLSAGVRHEYQTIIDPGNDHNDWRIYAGLGFDF